jgi:hypothetical protein
VAVVAVAGQALARNTAPLGAGGAREHVEQREADRLLELRVALDLDVGAFPEVIEVGALLCQQHLPASLLGGTQRGGHLIAQRGQRALLRPAIGDVLDHVELLAGLQHVGEHVPRDVGRRLR